MINVRAFEQALLETASGSPLYGAAGGKKTASKRLPIKPAPSDEEVEVALVAAQARLQQHPELLSGDPNGVFTFEDPVLAAASTACASVMPLRKSCMAQPVRLPAKN